MFNGSHAEKIEYPPLDRFVPLWSSMFMEEIFGFFYGDKEKNNVDIPQGHRLSLLYMYVVLIQT